MHACFVVDGGDELAQTDGDGLPAVAAEAEADGRGGVGEGAGHDGAVVAVVDDADAAEDRVHDVVGEVGVRGPAVQYDGEGQVVLRVLNRA